MTTRIHARHLPPRAPVAINWHSPQARGLHWYWCLAQARGANHVIEPRENHAIWQGAPTWVTDDERGVVLSFDGSDDYLSTTHEIYPPQFPISISAWFRTSTSNGGCVVGNGNVQTGTSSGYEQLLYLTDSGVITWGYKSGSYVCQSASGYNDGAWHNVVATTDGVKGKELYVDGELVDTHSNTDQSFQIGWWRIGHQTLQFWPNEPTSYFLNGRIDDVRIYNRALTAPEAWAIYAPESRYDLWLPVRRLYVVIAPAGGTTHSLQGSSDAVSTGAGALSVDHVVDGSADAVSTADAALTVDHTVAGSADAVSTGTGALSVDHVVDGSADAVSTGTGALTVDHAVTGSADAVSTAEGALSIEGAVVLTGAADATTTTAGALSVAHSLIGSADSAAGVGGMVLVDYALVGLSEGQTVVTGNLAVPSVDTDVRPQIPDGPRNYEEAMDVYMKMLLAEYGWF